MIRRFQVRYCNALKYELSLLWCAMMACRGKRCTVLRLLIYMRCETMAILFLFFSLTISLTLSRASAPPPTPLFPPPPSHSNPGLPASLTVSFNMKRDPYRNISFILSICLIPSMYLMLFNQTPLSLNDLCQFPRSTKLLKILN